MRKIRQQTGVTLIELIVVVAISAIVVVPLAAIFQSQLRIPAKLASEVTAGQQIQIATLLLIEDARAAQTFTPGDDPIYGTFTRNEFSGPAPIPVSSQYEFEPGEVVETVAGPGGESIIIRESGRLVRILDRGGEITPPIVILVGIAAYEDVIFQVEAPLWSFDPIAKTWTYAEGKVTVSIRQIHEAGAQSGEEPLVEALIADFRPQEVRPVALPPPD